MKIKRICSFILVYFVTSGLVRCDGDPKVVAVPGILVNANNASVVQPNATSSTIAPPAQSSTKAKSVPKKEATTEKVTIISTSTTVKPLATTLPTKQSSNATNSIATEGGLIHVTVNNRAQIGIALNSTSTANASSILSSTTISSTSSSSSSSTTTTTTTTKPPPTTPIPKPTMTLSDEDQPDNLPKDKSSSTDSQKGAHNAEEPHALSSKEQEQFNPHRDFVVPLVTFIFALPIFLGVAVIGYRKLRDYWSTRHYRRMDFLVDGMYND